MLWLFISNLSQLHLMPLIEAILQHLTNQGSLMLEVVRRFERLEGAPPRR